MAFVPSPYLNALKQNGVIPLTGNALVHQTGVQIQNLKNEEANRDAGNVAGSAYSQGVSTEVGSDTTTMGNQLQSEIKSDFYRTPIMGPILNLSPAANAGIQGTQMLIPFARPLLKWGAKKLLFNASKQALTSLYKRFGVQSLKQLLTESASEATEGVGDAAADVGLDAAADVAADAGLAEAAATGAATGAEATLAALGGVTDFAFSAGDAILGLISILGIL